MDLPANLFNQSLRDKRCAIGIWSMLGAAPCVELLSHAGFDWMLLDMEHGPIDIAELRAELTALAATSTTSPTAPIVRVKWNDTVEIKRVLDLGAQTLMVPFVQNAADARAAVAATRYPPAGVRGVAGGTRATRYGRVADYYSKAADELCVIVQVETRSGIDALRDIASVEGVDAVFIGPSDLAASYGYLGKPGEAEVQRAIEAAVQTIHACGKKAGTIATQESSARRMLELGFDFLAVGIDVGLLTQASDALVAKYA